MATYNLQAFIDACADPACMFVRPSAEVTADDDFKLRTKTKIYEFINSGGLESPVHITDEPLRKGATGDPGIIVAAYSFYSGPLYGYLAFFYSTASKKFIIKSFKKNTDPDPRKSVGNRKIGK